MPDQSTMTEPDNPAPTAPSSKRTPPRRTSRSLPLLIAGGLSLVLVLLALAWHSSSSHTTTSATSVQYAAGDVSTVELDGINGNLTVGVSNSSQITATAQPVHGLSAPNLTFHWNAASRTLALECSDSTDNGTATTCPATSYAVLVPAHVGVTLHEISGQASLSGLSGPVSVTASSADTSVRGLRTADFTAAITSGTLDASFATAPTHVSVSVTSAQASLQFPAGASYDVRQRSVSADIQVAIPQSSTSAHTVQVSATSGDINLGTTG
jgi:hypothetical protein